MNTFPKQLFFLDANREENGILISKNNIEIRGDIDYFMRKMFAFFGNFDDVIISHCIFNFVSGTIEYRNSYSVKIPDGFIELQKAFNKMKKLRNFI